MTPQELQEWITILSKPTAGVVMVVVLILYRSTVGHIIEGLFDVIYSWFKRK